LLDPLDDRFRLLDLPDDADLHILNQQRHPARVANVHKLRRDLMRGLSSPATNTTGWTAKPEASATASKPI
jgi:hypothetical protein